LGDILLKGGPYEGWVAIIDDDDDGGGGGGQVLCCLIDWLVGWLMGLIYLYRRSGRL